MIGDLRNIVIVGMAGLAFGGFMYLKGQSAGERIGEAREQLKASQIELARLEVTRALQSQIDDLSARQAATETQRQTVSREIRHESERIVERPVYRTVCVDPDGLRLLDQAADIANAKPAESFPAPSDATAGTAETPPNPQHMTGADCLRSLIDLYDIAGQTRAQLVALQAQVQIAEGADR